MDTEKITQLVEKVKKPLLYTTIGLFAVAALIGIGVVLFSVGDLTTLKVLSTTALLGFFALLNLNNINRLTSDDKVVKRLAMVSMVANILWCIPWILQIWGVLQALMCKETLSLYGYSFYQCSEGFEVLMGNIWKMVWLATNVAFLCTYSANVLKMKDYTEVIKIMKVVAIVLLGFMSLYTTPAVLFEAFDYISNSYQLIAVIFIVWAFCSITLPILHGVNSKKADADKRLEELRSASGNAEAMRAEMEQKIRAEIAEEMRAKEAATLQPILASEPVTIASVETPAVETATAEPATPAVEPASIYPTPGSPSEPEQPIS